MSEPKQPDDLGGRVERVEEAALFADRAAEQAAALAADALNQVAMLARRVAALEAAFGRLSQGRPEDPGARSDSGLDGAPGER